MQHFLPKAAHANQKDAQTANKQWKMLKQPKYTNNE